VARKTIATKNAAKSDQLSLKDAFKREKSVLQRLLSLGTDHRHLVELFASYTLDSNYYLLLTCADYDLETLFQMPSRPSEFGSTTEQQCARLYGSFYCLASALDYLHRLPVYHPSLNLNEIIYHHDLKPANILIKENVFMIADFGLSGFKHQEDTKTDWHGGTYSYSPPEYFSSAHITSASGGRKVDIWSLGCIFSEILTFIVLGNGTNGVSNFKRMRAEGPSTHLFNPETTDSSFHNNLLVVRSWLSEVLTEDNNPTAGVLVRLIGETLSIDPAGRPTSEVLCERLTHILSDEQLGFCGCIGVN
jgi:serine/threonine protein kinase